MNIEISGDTKEGPLDNNGGRNPMYVIRAVGDTCEILDQQDRVCFAGSLWECESWLDYQENLQSAPQTAPHRAKAARAAFGILPRWMMAGRRRVPNSP